MKGQSKAPHAPPRKLHVEGLAVTPSVASSVATSGAFASEGQHSNEDFRKFFS